MLSQIVLFRWKASSHWWAWPLDSPFKSLAYCQYRRLILDWIAWADSFLLLGLWHLDFQSHTKIPCVSYIDILIAIYWWHSCETSHMTRREWYKSSFRGTIALHIESLSCVWNESINKSMKVSIKVWKYQYQLTILCFHRFTDTIVTLNHACELKVHVRATFAIMHQSRPVSWFVVSQCWKVASCRNRHSQFGAKNVLKWHN